MRRGMPPIENVVELLPQRILEEVREDAVAVFDEIGFVGLYEGCRKALTCASLPDAVRQVILEALAKADGRNE
jgi:hypothetical protein